MADEHDDPPANPWAAPPEGAQAGQPGAPSRRALPPPASSAFGPPDVRDERRRRPSPRPTGRSGPGRGPGDGSGSSSARVGIVLGLIGLLVVNDAGYGLAFGLGAAVLGGFALRDARAGRSSMTSALGALLVGLVVVSMSLSLLALSRTKDISDLERCLDRAQTHEAQAACRQNNGNSQGLAGRVPGVRD